MSVPSQNIPIQFGGGIDSKSDPKVVKAGKLLRLQDAVQIAAGQWRKRNGGRPLPTAVIGGGSITSPKLLTTFKNELVCADSALGQLLSYSPTQQAWAPKGVYVPVKVSNTVVSRYFANNSIIGHVNTSGAALGNIAIFSWKTLLSNGSAAAMGSVIDLSNGTTLISDAVLGTAFNAQSVVINGTTLGFVYATSTNIFLITVTASGSTVSLSAPITVVTDTINTFQAISTPTGAAIAYFNGSNLKVLTIDASGSITHSVTGAASTTAGNPTLSVEPTTNNVWIYWYESSTLHYAIYSPTLTSVLAATSIASIGTSANNLIAVPTSTGHQTLLYTTTQITAGKDLLCTTSSVTVQSSGTTGTPAIYLTNVMPICAPFSLGGVQYVGFCYASSVQGTYFFVRFSDGTTIAKALSGSADPNPTGVFTYPIQVSATQALIPCAQSYTILTNGSQTAPLTGSNYITLDSGSPELNLALEANDNLILNGGQIHSYDGKRCTESGFHLTPTFVSATPSSSGGNLAAGAYEYFLTFRYTDNQGNIVESEPSLAISVTQAAGSTNSCALVFSTLSQTLKQTVNGTVEIFVWRTLANGTTAKLIQQISNNPSVSTLSFTDGIGDGALTSAAQLYTSGGVLGNQAPPAAVAMCLHNNRVWLIPSDSTNQVWYSQTLTPTAGINFSSDLLIDVDAVGGQGVALAGMDDKLVIFEEKLPLVIAGDGAGPTGQGSTLSSPQPIPSDAGCISQKSVIVFSQGVLRKTAKGLYLLDRKLGDSYFGIDVEGYNSQDIQASTQVASNTHLRFLTSSGLSLNYDYVFQQWSTFTNYQGYAACNWQGGYVYARTDGSIHQETPGYYLDNVTPISPLVRLPWLAFAGIQGFQRVRDFLMLGNYANGASASHGVQVSAAYDFVESFSTPIPYLFGNANTSGPFQYQEQLPRQKCDSISLIIQEITTGDSAEYISFTDMSFEAGVKRGLNKLPKTRSVG